MLQSHGTSVTAPAVPTAVRTLRSTAASAATRLGAPPPVVDAVRLAVSEAASLAVRRARVADRPCTVEVGVHAAGDELVVCVHDEVPPRTDLGTGLALSLMSRLADSVRLDQSDDGGTDVVLRFRRA